MVLPFVPFVPGDFFIATIVPATGASLHNSDSSRMVPVLPDGSFCRFPPGRVPECISLSILFHKKARGIINLAVSEKNPAVKGFFLGIQVQNKPQQIPNGVTDVQDSE